MHPLLARQLRKAGLDTKLQTMDLDEAVLRLLSLVSSAYDELDQERRRNDRASHLMSDELTALNEAIRRQANHDPLTGLPNRTLFVDRLTNALSVAARTGQTAAVMFVDLDGFKLVNDTLGHASGDRLLQETAIRLQSCLRAGDTVARLGGDEFTILMPALEEYDFASVVAERIIITLERPFDFGGQEASISVSIGIATFPQDAEDAQGLLKAADVAMYRAKEQSKGCYQFYTSGMAQESQDRLALKSRAARALDRGELALVYQPKVSLRDGSLGGVEALLRWHSPEFGEISPCRFIPIMEESGLIVVVGEWTIDQACRQVRAWRDDGLPTIRVAVNLSVRQLRNGGLPGLIKRLLRRHGLPAQALEIEVTESMLMKEAGLAATVLAELHGMGLQIAMDDFGTGYSSLRYLSRFPIDTIKIDQCFIRDLVTHAEDAEIVRAAISMGHALHRRVVAEGVETEAQIALLRRLHCDEVQGYAICPPQPPAQLQPLLERLSSAAVHVRAGQYGYCGHLALCL